MLRPKVCKPPPPPPPPEVLPPRDCYFDPDTDTVTVGDDWNPVFHACCPELPEEDPVSVELDAAGGEWSGPESFLNCVDDDSNTWTPPDEEGICIVSCKYTWSDGGTCTAYATLTVEEEEEED